VIDALLDACEQWLEPSGPVAAISITDRDERTSCHSHATEQRVAIAKVYRVPNQTNTRNGGGALRRPVTAAVVDHYDLVRTGKGPKLKL
jgi:hypothetical protein